jgi:hypothetical protein
LIEIQLPEKYKENFDVSSEGASTCTRIMINIISINLLNNERMFTVKCGPINTTYAINSGRIV